MIDTDALIRCCINNEIKAQKILYHQYANAMLSVCYRYCNSIHDAQDVLQEGFIKVFKHLYQFNKQGELGAWIRRIMVNEALSFIQKKNKIHFTDLSEQIEESINPSVEIKLAADELTTLIKNLPIGYQTILNLHAIEGYTHVEIAALLNISDSTSRTQYLRAKKLLLLKIQQQQMNTYKMEKHA